MSQSFEVQGEIHSIGDTNEYGNNGFTKREFVIKLTGEGENPAYPNYLAMELIKDKCGIMDAYKLGDEIKVHFNLSGRLWSPRANRKNALTACKPGAWNPSARCQNTIRAFPTLIRSHHRPCTKTMMCLSS